MQPKEDVLGGGWLIGLVAARYQASTPDSGVLDGPVRDPAPRTRFAKPWAAHRRAMSTMIGLGLFLWGLHVREVTPGRLIDGFGQLGRVFMPMMPPAVTEKVWDYVRALGKTLAMASLGILVASLLAVPLALMGACNIMPVGLGPFAGILAIAINNTGVLTKLYAEAIETTDREQAKGLRANGAGRTWTIDFGVLPQVLPVLLGNSLYVLESNVRSATMLGVVGAGGIGFFLMDRMMINAWREVALIVIMVLLTAACIGALPRIRCRRLIGPVTRRGPE